MNTSNPKQPNTTQKSSLKSQAAKKRRESAKKPRPLPDPAKQQWANAKFKKYTSKYDARVYAQPTEMVLDRDYIKAVLGCHDYHELPSGQVGHIGPDYFWFRPVGESAWFKFPGRLEARVYPGTFISGAWCLMMSERDQRVYVTTFFPDYSRVKDLDEGLLPKVPEWNEPDVEEPAK